MFSLSNKHLYFKELLLKMEILFQGKSIQNLSSPLLSSVNSSQTLYNVSLPDNFMSSFCFSWSTSLVGHMAVELSIAT